MHSDTGVQEGAFADEVEFRLFVDATAGLGPEQVLRTPAHRPTHDSVRSYELARQPYSWDEVHHHSNLVSPTERQVSPLEEKVSPLEETPTTVWALQQLAQMPQASLGHRRQSTLESLQQFAQLPQASSDHLPILVTATPS